MIRLTKPTTAWLSRYVERQSEEPLGYAPAGLTRGKLSVAGDALAETPRGFVSHHQSVQVGQGEAAFEAACTGLRRWAMMPPGMIEVFPPAGSARPGQAIAVVIRSLGLWWINSARVLFVDEPAGDANAEGERTFAITYGTLPDHLECGEERFGLRQKADGSVWYELTVVWRSNKWLSKLAPFMVRREQARFRRLSAAAVEQAIRQGMPKVPSS